LAGRWNYEAPDLRESGEVLRLGHGVCPIIAYKRGKVSRPSSLEFQVMLGFSLVERGFFRAIGLLAAGLAIWLAIGAGDASARTERAGDRRASPAGQRETWVKPAPGPLIAVVSLARQRISIYGKDGLLAQSAVSTGQPGFRTPTGVFSVIQKNRYHRSNIYSGAPMPFMQRITWSGVALHAGVVPGYPASHGCIRLPSHFAVELWGMTKMGARVIVAPDDTTAVEINSARLPLPTLTPAAEGTPVADQSRPEVVSVALSGQGGEAVDATKSGPRVLNPFERAKAAKIQTAADALAKGKAAKAAVEFSATKAAAANKAIVGLRSAELAVASARGKLEAATKALDVVKTPEAAERAKAVVAAAEAVLANATKAEDEARAEEAAATPEALAAARAAWDAENASRTAAADAKAAERGTDPISIFISKKTNRLYIRQAWAPIHEVAVTIKEPEALIGTHTYLAVEPAADSKSLRWLSVTFPPASAKPTRRDDDDDDDDDRLRSRRGKPAQPVEAVPARPHETAAGALERIEMPEETRQFISERLWTGASLIISDQGMSNETGTYTDFIVQPR
jgi:L,D-transpeptidase catalytic domain